MLIGIGLVTAQQITGQPNVIYYASDIFKAVGYCTEWSSTLATVGLGTMKVIATALSLSLVDRIGRKKCLTIGILVMGLAILTLGIFAITNGSEASKQTCHEFINDTLTVNGTTTHKPLETEKKIIFCSSNHNQRRPGNSQIYSRISNSTWTV
jgi:MFS family permease